MKVWIVLGADLSNDPCSDVMGVFSDETRALEYRQSQGKTWWDIVVMTVDDPESWEYRRDGA